MGNAVLFLWQEHPRAKPLLWQIVPKVVQTWGPGNPFNQSDGNSCNSSGSVDNNGSISLLSALVDYLSFDLEASLKHPCCCACSLKGIADKTSFEVFREEGDTGNLF